MSMHRRCSLRNGLSLGAVLVLGAMASAAGEIGREVAVERHLQDGEEFTVSTRELIEHGRKLFTASWTAQEGAGRPQTKGVGTPLSDPFDPLVFPRDFNRLSGPDANSCAACHNLPRTGGGGDFVANVFVLGQRFDFATFDPVDAMPTRGSMDENGDPVTLQGLANSRSTPGMFGSGYIEMLARQISADLRALRDALPPGAAAELVSKGISFGVLERAVDGSWIVAGVEGLAAPSLATSGPADPPSLLIRPFHQAGAVVSLRQFTNGALNHHHGIQSAERFGAGADPDGDGHVDEVTRADVTAVTVFQAQLPVPGRVIPRDPEVEAAVGRGERLFLAIGCADCHVPVLELDADGWIYREPNPFNPPGNLGPVDGVPSLEVDLGDPRLDLPRLRPRRGRLAVPAFTDLKLHDITAGPFDPNREPLDMHQPAGSPEFFAGNSRFLTRKLWGVASEPPFFHHGLYTTMRQSIEAHRGEAEGSYLAWQALAEGDRDALVEFLKTLRVLPPGSRHLVVDERGRPRPWRAAWESGEADSDSGSDSDSDSDSD